MFWKLELQGTLSNIGLGLETCMFQKCSQPSALSSELPAPPSAGGPLRLFHSPLQNRCPEQDTQYITGTLLPSELLFIRLLLLHQSYCSHLGTPQTKASPPFPICEGDWIIFPAMQLTWTILWNMLTIFWTPYKCITLKRFSHFLLRACYQTCLYFMVSVTYISCTCKKVGG